MIGERSRNERKVSQDGRRRRGRGEGWGQGVYGSTLVKLMCTCSVRDVDPFTVPFRDLV